MKICTLNKDGSVTKVKTIDQSKLTSDCWLIQIYGIEACKTCEVRGTDECGGKEILKRIKEVI